MKDFSFYTKINGEKTLIYWIYLRDKDGNLIKKNLYNPKTKAKFKSRREIMDQCGKSVKINGEKTPEISPNDIFVEVDIDYAFPLLIIGGALGYAFYSIIGCAVGSIFLLAIGLALNSVNKIMGRGWNSEFIPEEELKQIRK